MTADNSCDEQWMTVQKKERHITILSSVKTVRRISWILGNSTRREVRPLPELKQRSSVQTLVFTRCKIICTFHHKSAYKCICAINDTTNYHHHERSLHQGRPYKRKKIQWYIRGYDLSRSNHRIKIWHKNTALNAVKTALFSYPIAPRRLLSTQFPCKRKGAR